MMSIKRLITIITIFFITLTDVHAQNEFCGIKNNSFKEGEKIYFKVFYNMGALWIGAGLAIFNTTLEDLNGRKVYHVVGDGKTLKSYEWFYRVADKYETFIDVETLMPLRFVRNVDEGGFKIYNNVNFNSKAGQAVSTDGTYKIPECIQDVLSAIYYARNIDYNKYKPGDKIPFNMFLDNQVYNLYIRYIGKEQITTKYGTFNAIKFSPLLIDGTIFKGGEKMVVWVSDDKNHIPVRIDSPILVGSIKVDMVGYENLRNPFSGLLSKNK